MPQARSKRISDQDWDQHRALVLTRYLHEKKTLKEVRAELESKDFLVSLSQLEFRCKKWNFSKHLDRATWKSLSSVEDPTLFWKGQPLDDRKVSKEMRRHGLQRSRLGPGSRNKTSNTTQARQETSIVRLNDVEPSQGPSRFSRPVKRRHLGHQLLRGHTLHGSFGQAELDALTELLSNLSIWDFFNFRYHHELINWAYHLIKSLEVAGLSLDTGEMIFQAALHGLWLEIFSCEFSNKTDEYDQRFLKVVEWLLRMVQDCSMLWPSLPAALLWALREGSAPVASLLWEKLTPSQRSNLEPLQPDVPREIATQESKEALLLLQRMLSPESGGWALVTLQSISQYSSEDMFRSLLPSLFSHFASLSFFYDGQETTPTQIVGLCIARCAQAEPEDIACLKLQAVYGCMGSFDMPVSTEHVNADAFMAAAARGYSTVLERLMTINPNPGVTSSKGFSALHTAAENGQLEICKQILRVTPSEQQDNDTLVLALYLAIAGGYYNICQLFQERLRGSDMEHLTVAEWRKLFCSCPQARAYRELPLHARQAQPFFVGPVKFAIGDRNPCIVCYSAWLACQEGLLKMLAFCLDHGTDPSFELSYKPAPSLLDGLLLFRGPLHTKGPPLRRLYTFPNSGLPARRVVDDTSFVDRMACARLLLRSGIQPTERHVTMSLMSGDLNMAQLLLRQGVNISVGTFLEASICGRNAKSIEFAHRQAGLVYHAGALCAAVLFSQDCTLSRAMALDMISKRDPKDPGDPKESTAIGFAAMHNDHEMLSKLFEAIPRPAQLMNCNPGPRYDLLLPGSPERVSRLLQKRCKEEGPFWQSEKFQVSPLALAVLDGVHEATLTLLKHEIRPDIFACSRAVRHKDQRILALLLRGQPPLRQWGHATRLVQYLPLHYAISCHDSNDDYHDHHGDLGFRLVRQLLSAGADINDPDRGIPGGRSPLQAAAQEGNLSMAKFLLNRGADVNGPPVEERGATALQAAVMGGFRGMVELLLDHGADVNAPAAQKEGRTCLQGAAEQGRFSILDLLLTKGVSTDGRQRIEYVFALILAKKERHLFLAHHLKSHGGWTEWDEAVSEEILQWTKEAECEWDEATLEEKREVEMKACNKFTLSRRADTTSSTSNISGGAGVETHTLRQDVVKLIDLEASMAQENLWTQCLPSSPRDMMGAHFAFRSPQGFDFLDIPSQSQIPSEGDGLFEWDFAFMRECEEDVFIADNWDENLF